MASPFLLQRDLAVQITECRAGLCIQLKGQNSVNCVQSTVQPEVTPESGLCSTHESLVKFDSTLTQMSRVRVESAVKIKDMSRVRVESR